MAGSPRTYYRNYNASDSTKSRTGKAGDIVLSPSDVGFTAPTGYEFAEWNSLRDGSGTSIPVGEAYYASDNLYAIWQEIADVNITYRGSSIATMNASGTKTLLTENMYCDDDIVVEYTKTIGSATTPTTTITANPSISVSPSGLITATASASQSITPTVSAGYVSSGTAGTVSVSGSNTSQLTVQAAQTITPTTTNQTIASGKYLTGAQTILGDANLVAGNIKKDVTIFGVTGTHEGGTPSYTLIASSEQTVTTTQTYQGLVVTINFTNAISMKKWYLVRIRDKAGKRAGYFYGTDTMFAPYPGTASSTNNNAVRLTYHADENSAISAFVGTSSSYVYGVYPTGIDSGYINIYKKYNSSFGTIDGTFSIEIYELDDPSGTTPLE